MCILQRHEQGIITEPIHPLNAELFEGIAQLGSRTSAERRPHVSNEITLEWFHGREINVAGVKRLAGKISIADEAIPYEQSGANQVQIASER
jgi:hypothetical protein